VPGFGGREDVLRRYAARTGADVSGISFYVALGLWKLACIAEGINARFRQGAMGSGDGPPAEWFAERVPQLAQHALDVLREDDH
jgi:aminoglycoside phosphotransferase (APT) family kinase protein